SRRVMMISSPCSTSAIRAASRCCTLRMLALFMSNKMLDKSGLSIWRARAFEKRAAEGVGGDGDQTRMGVIDAEGRFRRPALAASNKPKSRARSVHGGPTRSARALGLNRRLPHLPQTQPVQPRRIRPHGVDHF